MSGSRLMKRIRSKMFSCYLRQEVGYFDESENSCGAICTRLSSDASSIQKIMGTQLGALCESLSITCFSLLLGFAFHWQLTIIILFPLLIYISLFYVSIHRERSSRKQISLVFERANQV